MDDERKGEANDAPMDEAGEGPNGAHGGSPAGAESGESGERSKGGQFRKGWKGGPGRPKTIHPAPLFDGDELTKALPGFKTEDVVPPAKPAEDDGPPAGDVVAVVPPDIAAAIERDGLTAVYLAALKGSQGGNASATKNLFMLIERYRGDVQETQSELSEVGAYAGLPQEAVEILAELDVGLAEVLNRWKRGLPMSDIELVIAETANAVRQHGPESPEAGRWSAVVIHEVSTLNERDPRHEQIEKRQGPAIGRPVGAD